MQIYEKRSILTDLERTLLAALEDALPDYRIMPQVALAALIAPKGGNRNIVEVQRHLARETVGFVLEHRTSRLVTIAEPLSTETARTSSAASSGPEKDRILKSAGYRVLRIGLSQAADKARLREWLEHPELDALMAPSTGTGPEPVDQRLPSSDKVSRAVPPSAGAPESRGKKQGSRDRLALRLALGLAAVFLAYSVVDEFYLSAPKKEVAQPFYGLLSNEKMAVASNKECKIRTAEMLRRPSPPESKAMLEALDKENCLQPALKEFQVGAILPLPRVTELYNLALDKSLCPQHATWALDVLGDSTLSERQQYNSVKIIFADADTRGCLEKLASR